MGRVSAFARCAATVLVAGAAALAGPAGRSVAAAEGGSWDTVLGSAGIGNSSRYQVVEIAPDGSVYLAGWFKGSFAGLSQPTGYGVFIQKLSSAGKVAWTKAVGDTTTADEPGSPDLVVDGLGNPYLKVCNSVNCRVLAYAAGNGSLSKTFVEPVNHPWPIIAATSGAAGGVLAVEDGSAGPSVKRLSPTLGETWSFSLAGKLADPAGGTDSFGIWLVEAPNGSFWAIGVKAGTTKVMAMVHIGAGGNHLGTIEHAGGVPFDNVWAGRPVRRAPLSPGPGGHVWISTGPAGSVGFDQTLHSYSLVDGKRVGVVSLTTPQEQVAVAGGFARCISEDLAIVYGVGGPASFAQQALAGGTWFISVFRCEPLAGGGDVRMLAAYSTTSPIGGAYVREAVVPFPDGAKVLDVAVDADGNTVFAGSTAGQPHYLAPSAPASAATTRAAVARNPFGGPLDSPDFVSLTPARVFDTRRTEPDGLVVVPKPPTPVGGELRVRIAGAAGVPANGIGAVSLNVTVTNPVAPGFITTYPCGRRPLASNLNFLAGQTVANAVIAPVSPDGEVCFFASAATDLLADVNGWFRTQGGFRPVTPIRMFDTRPTERPGVIDVAKRLYSGTSEVRVRIADVPGAPAGAKAVSLNVTATQPSDAGWVAVYPCGRLPLVSNVNFVAGQTVPNAVVAPLGSDSELCFHASADTHLVVDINGYFVGDAGFRTVAPARVLDTRPGELDGKIAVAKRTYGGAQVLKVRITGTAGVPPAGVAAVSLNVTAVWPEGPGFVTVYPCGERPLASNVNYVAGVVVPNAVFTPVSDDGEVCFFSLAATHLVVDVNGWFPK